MNHRLGFLAAPGFMLALSCAALAPSCGSSGKSDTANPGSGGSGNAGGGTPGSGGAGSGTSGSGNAGGGATGSGGTAGAATGSGNAGGAGSGTAGGAGSGAGTAGAAAGSGAAGTSGGRGEAGAGSAGATGSGGGSAGSTGGQWSSTFPTFTKHTIASFSSGYSMVVADIDHDGMPDVVALSSASAGLVWFKNPSWQKYTVTTKAKQLIFTAPYDVDGDGDIDLAVVSDFAMSDTSGGGTVSWAENPGDPTKNQDWALHKIDAVPTAHRLRWADIDGNGKKELILLPLFGMGSSAPAYAGAVQLKAYTIPASPKDAQATWTAQVLDNTHLEVAHGLTIVDWDGDKAEDILTAANDGVDLFRPSLGKAAEHLGNGAGGQAPNKGSSEVGLGSLGGARFIATIDPWHGTDGVIYTPGASASEVWTRQVLGTDFEHGHGLDVGDFNGDGYDEVVAGGGQGTMSQLIYRYVPSTRKWDKIMLDVGGVAVSGLEVRDMNGDGALDIVAIGGSPTNNVVWYENSR